MNFGVRLTLGLGPCLLFTSCVTVGLSLCFLSSMRDITDVQEIANDSVVLIRVQNESMVGAHRRLFWTFCIKQLLILLLPRWG